MPQKTPFNVRHPFRLNLSAWELSQLLTQAKAAHSSLPADYPAHNWEDWYAEWIVEKLESQFTAGIPAEYDETQHDSDARPIAYRADYPSDDTECRNFDCEMINQNGRIHVWLIYIVLALAAIAFGLFV